MRSLVANYVRKVDLEDAGTLADGKTKLQQKASNLVDKTCALAHVPVADSMQSLACALLWLPNLNKAHRRSGYGLCDSCGVNHIVLVGLDVGLHELSWNNLHRVAHRL